MPDPPETRRRDHLNEIDHFTALTAQIDSWIIEAVSTLDRDDDLNNLDSIPGIAAAAARVILAETSGDMTQFATPGRLASWIGVCPGMNESAGVSKSSHIRRGNANLKRILGTAAMAAVKQKDTYYAEYYRRIAARRGDQRALVAVMHKLVIAIWHALDQHIPYRELDPEHFTRHDRERAIRRITEQADALGLTVRFDIIGA
jgi:transposase